MAKPKTQASKKLVKAKKKEQKLSLDLEDKPINVNVWDGASVKNLLDDAVKKYTLEASESVGAKFEENYSDTDFKLAICTLACLAATFAVVYGYFVPHPDSALVVGSCAATYFALVTFLTIYSLLYDTQILLSADRTVSENPRIKEEVALETILPRYDICYQLKITYTRKDAQGNVIGTPIEEGEDWLISDFFYENGVFAVNLVEEKIMNLISDIRKRN
eukprot:m.336586 g.336586  ORF g.336586 m.336586 type:complete len:219 (-) comp17900_c0_seq1:30-686(-)